MLSENLAPLRLVRVRGALVLHARGRAVSFQRSRMVRQPAVNRSSRRFDSSRWSCDRPGRWSLELACAPARLAPRTRGSACVRAHASRWSSTMLVGDLRSPSPLRGEPPPGRLGAARRPARQAGRFMTSGACDAPASLAPRTRGSACVRAHASRWSSTRIVSGVNPVRLRAWALVSSTRTDPTRKVMLVRIQPPRPTLRRLAHLGVADW